MILTGSDVSRLSAELSWWEAGEYFCSFIVAAACFGEYVADFLPKWYQTGDTERDENRKEFISKTSTLVLTAALVFELLCVVRSNVLAGRVIGSIDDHAKSADTRAQTALNKANGAQVLAKSASDISEKAKGTAGTAEALASATGKQTTAIAGQLNTASAELNAISQQTGETRTVLAQMDLERAALEASLAARKIPIIENSSTKQTNVDSLKPFAQVTANIMCVPGTEPKRASLQIENALQIARWKILPPGNTCTEIGFGEGDWGDGVAVISGPESDRAAEALVCLLHRFGWAATSRMGTDRPSVGFPQFLVVSPGTINVYVLPHPIPYLDEKQEEESVAQAFAGNPEAKKWMIKNSRESFLLLTGRGEKEDPACAEAEGR